ncbi:MAG: hypothetical protein ABFS39_19900 [Pseudomonadota bacterium]
MQKANEVASPNKSIAVFPPAIAQATLCIQVLAKLLQCQRIQRLYRRSGPRSPSGKSPGTAQMSPDLVATVASLSELRGEVIQVRTGGAGAEIAKREWVFEVGGQHAVLLILRVKKDGSIMWSESTDHKL